MIIKNKISALVIGCFTIAFAQNSQAQDSIIKPIIKLSYLDSIKSTFVSDALASCIDDRWSNELSSLDVYEDMISDIANVDPDVKVDYELPTELLKERLKKMDEKSPFNIEYNIGLENVIKSFLKNRRRSFERLMGISQFYFPIFEEELAKKNIPLEIKYLAVVESALNPRAVSRVGATGLWQFMYQTGKQYGLNISSYTDERSDPLKSSEAASQYMTNMYRIFGDWDLVLAAYNSGPGNVSKAIRRSGGQQNYWNIRKNLPKETQGYLPAFLATMYIFEYHKEHGIVPNKAIANHFATDTIMVKRHMSFKEISDLLDVTSEEIAFFNPSYKRNEVPYISGQPNFLRLPKNKIAVFTSNEAQIYGYIDYQDGKRERPNDAIASRSNSKATEETSGKAKYYKVQRGDNLSSIAAKYNVSLNDLKRWNGMRSNALAYGKTLRINIEKEEDTSTKSEVAEVIKEEVVATQKTTVIAENSNSDSDKKAKDDKVFVTEKVVTFKDVTKLHKVKSGDNLTEIANKYNVSANDIKKWNKLKGNNIQAGANLKIITNEKITTVVKKEVKANVMVEKERIAVAENVTKPNQSSAAAVIANTAKETELIADAVVAKPISNEIKKEVVETPITKTAIKEPNAEIAVAKTEIKESKTVIAETEAKTNPIVTKPITTEPKKAIAENSKDEPKLSTNGIYTVVKSDNLYLIAKDFNTTVANLKAWNNLETENIAIGDKLVIAEKKPIIEEVAKNKYHVVEKGEFLGQIARSYNLTINELLELNNLSSTSVLAGTKLIVGTEDNQVVANKSSQMAKFENSKNYKAEKLYQVKKGDSLFSISKQFSVPVADIKKWNEMKDEKIQPGMKLKING
jgi:membrane-bound lytic murein transglycosylase D